MSHKYVESESEISEDESGYESLTESDFEILKDLVSFQSYSNNSCFECPDDKMIVEIIIDKKSLKIKRVKNKSGEYIGFDIKYRSKIRENGWFISGCENNLYDCLKMDPSI